MQQSNSTIINALLDNQQITDPTLRQFYENSVLNESLSFVTDAVSAVDFSTDVRNQRLQRILSKKQEELFASHAQDITYAHSLLSEDPENATLAANLAKAIKLYQSEVRTITNLEVQKHLLGIQKDVLKVIKEYRQSVADYVSQPHNRELGELLKQDRANIASINTQLLAMGASGSFSATDIKKFRELFNDAIKQVAKSRERFELLNNPEPAPTAEEEMPKNPVITKVIESSMMKLLKTKNITPEDQKFYKEKFGQKILKHIGTDIENLGALPHSPEFLRIIERNYLEIFKILLGEIQPYVENRASLYERLAAVEAGNDATELFDKINEIESNIEFSIEEAMTRSAKMIYREAKVYSFKNPLEEKIHRLEFLSDSMFRSFKDSIISDQTYCDTLKKANDTLNNLFHERNNLIDNFRYDNEGADYEQITQQFNSIEQQIDQVIQNASIDLDTQINIQTQSYLSKVSQQLLVSLSGLETTMQTELQAFQQADPHNPALREIKKTIATSKEGLASIEKELKILAKKDLSKNENIDNLKKIIDASINIINKCRNEVHIHQKRSETQPELYAQASFLNKMMEALRAILKTLSSLFSKAEPLEPTKPRGPMTFSTAKTEPSQNTPRPQSF